MAASDIPQEVEENPIDFDALKKENADIYAWVRVPGTNVDHPIVQHPDDDFFYLKHDVDGEASDQGAIYTEIQNSKDFSDGVTVVYGHNINGGLMFATLHDFEDEAFFGENREFFIYTPTKRLTYKIVAASGADDSHILNTHDFTNKEELADYFEQVKNPSTLQNNVHSDVQLGEDSKIVQLSTCNYTFGNERYILTGVLVDSCPTA